MGVTPPSAVAAKPLSSVGIVDLPRSQLVLVAAISAGTVIAFVLLWARRRCTASADAPFAPPHEERAARIGEVGERLVACGLAALGWPAPHNVILAEPLGQTVELDHLVRASDGIVVLETKIYSGFVAGGAVSRGPADLVSQSGDSEREPCPRSGTVRRRPRGAGSRLRGVGWQRALR